MAGMETKVYTVAMEGDKPAYKPFLSIKLVPTALAAMIVTWIFGWLYMGGSWDPLSYISNIQIAIMNCDDGVSGATIEQFPPSFAASATVRMLYQPFSDTLLYNAIWNPASPASGVFFWKNVTCSKIPDSNYVLPGQSQGCGRYNDACYQEAMDLISDGDYWNVWFIPSNFTANYLSWYTPTRGVYPVLQRVLSFNIYGRGRSFTTYSFINGVFNAVYGRIQAGVFAQVSQQGVANITLLDPQVYAQPMGLIATDIHPVRYFGQHFASYVFCILLWLGATFCVAVFNQFKTPAEIRKLTGGDVTKMDLLRGVAIKALCAIFYMYLLTMLCHCILFALGQGDEQWEGYNAGYSIAFGWWLSFCNIAMNTVLLYLLGPEKFSSVSALLLVLQLTSGGAIFSEELSNTFFNIGQGMPFYYGVRGFRTIFFGTTKSLMYSNWLILLAWNVGTTILAFFIVIFKLGSMESLPEGAAAPVVIAVAA